MMLEAIKGKFQAVIRKLSNPKKSGDVYDGVVYIDPQSERAIRELERRRLSQKDESLRLRH